MDVNSTPQTPKAKSGNVNNFGDFSSPFLVPPTPAMTKIGYGTGVSIYRLNRSPRFGNERSPWAIKKRNAKIQKRLCTDITGRLREEAAILRSLNHPNIVGFRGFTVVDGKEVLIMEECTQSLGDFLENYKKLCKDQLVPLPILTVINVTQSICRALDYLHTECKLIHGDVKSYNILIKGEFESFKLCDFGVSLRIGEDGTSCEEYIGTLPWTAPEAFLEEPITVKVDIFAFGLTMYEILSIKQPHIPEFDESALDTTPYTEMDVSMEEPAYGTRMELPPLRSEYKDIETIYNWCTEEDYNKRPSAKEILDKLQ